MTKRWQRQNRQNNHRYVEEHGGSKRGAREERRGRRRGIQEGRGCTTKLLMGPSWSAAPNKNCAARPPGMREGKGAKEDGGRSQGGAKGER